MVDLISVEAGAAVIALRFLDPLPHMWVLSPKIKQLEL